MIAAAFGDRASSPLWKRIDALAKRTVNVVDKDLVAARERIAELEADREHLEYAAKVMLFSLEAAESDESPDGIGDSQEEREMNERKIREWLEAERARKAKG